MSDRTEHIEYRPPRCPDCGWSLRFRVVGVLHTVFVGPGYETREEPRWEAYCWNDPKACATGVVPVGPKPEPVVEVYARDECVFRYCPYPDICKHEDRCLSGPKPSIHGVR